MLKTPLTSVAALMGFAGVSLADVPKVATDIAPVHGLVARVMQGVGEPDMVVPAGASPHHHSMRPSEALALSRADVVFWMGEALTPWLEGAVEELAKDAHVVELLELEGGLALPFREGVGFEAHDHGEEEGHDDDHHDDHGDDHDDHEKHDDHDDHAEHDDHDDHDHEEHAEAEHAHEDEHEDGHDDDHEGHDHGGHEGHDHEGLDPHAWLSPENAKLWLDVIAAELSEHDAENAATYAANAAAGKQEIEAAKAEVLTGLEPLRSGGFVVFHDAYQYFEHSFGLQAAGAISLGDASDPSPARIAEIQQVVKDKQVSCVFSEPQFNPDMVATVLEGSGAKTVVIDPLGTGLELGAGFYPALLKELGAAMADCH
ncbi:zinc ABC transporter substrate-binding protein [Pseudophaeobacter sp. EL27]|uniref:zinc ABC transporter substrate-binding protein n=1 Tax=Pseudophaeobacter sp. EL27 TaxID=2107580 RepID=UPI0020B1237E|nr:zinc ABC transporter substrate-binding protein [Pseudophaeobacter sp. EL27]